MTRVKSPFTNQRRMLVSLALMFGLLLPWAFAQAINAKSLQDVNLTQLLDENWKHYQARFIQQDGRVIDHRIGVSTSEGQSYAMLRALWLRDKTTFDKTYDWANQNLRKRPVKEGQTASDKLYGWKWGQLPEKGWGLLDSTSATDADQDIALGLILAHKFWGDYRYKEDALALLKDIWDKETVESAIGRVVLPGDWEYDSKQIQINPSYFAPYAYRVFAEFDREHRWDELVESSYRILQRSSELTRTHLPPDWVKFSAVDGTVKLYDDPKDIRSDYGYEAIRVFWRLGVDALLNQEPESEKTGGSKLEKSRRQTTANAQALLSASDYLTRFWQVRGELPGTVSWDGIPRKDTIESAALYGASLPFFYYQKTPDSQAVLEDVLLKRVIPNMEPGGQWNTENDYYSQNWLWFGLASYAFLKKDVTYPKKLSPLGRLEWFMDLRSY